MQSSLKDTLTVTGLLFFLVAPITHADHSWSGYHWARQQNPFTLPVIDSVTSNWFVELDTALTKWSEATSLETVITETQTDETTRLNCPMAAGKLRVCNANYGSTGWLGLATIGVNSTGHLDKAVTRINDYYSSYWNSQSMKNHVMCHEVGHQFGLDHTSEDGSSQGTCMDVSQNINSQWPNAHDYEMIDNVIYAHLDNHDSFAGGSSSGTDSGTSGGTDGSTDSGSGSDGTTSGGGGKGKGKKGGNTRGDSTTDDPDASTCTSPAGKGCNKTSNGWTSNIPPLGVRISSTKREETWVSSRGDGGLWIHHIYKAADYATPGNGNGDDHDHSNHAH